MKRLTNHAKTLGSILAAIVFAGGFVYALIASAFTPAGVLLVLFALSLGMAFSSGPAHEPAEVRKFGFIALLFFGCFLALAVWKEKPFMIGLFGAMDTLGFFCALAPRLLAPIQGAWVTVGMGFANGVNGLFLILAYYLVITPFGMAKRLFSGRPIPFNPDKSADTYWVERKEPAQPRERYIKRY